MSRKQGLWTILVPVVYAKYCIPFTFPVAFINMHAMDGIMRIITANEMNIQCSPFFFFLAAQPAEFHSRYYFPMCLSSDKARCWDSSKICMQKREGECEYICMEMQTEFGPKSIVIGSNVKRRRRQTIFDIRYGNRLQVCKCLCLSALLNTPEYCVWVNGAASCVCVYTNERCNKCDIYRQVPSIPPELVRGHTTTATQTVHGAIGQKP